MKVEFNEKQKNKIKEFNEIEELNKIEKLDSLYDFSNEEFLFEDTVELDDEDEEIIEDMFPKMTVREKLRRGVFTKTENNYSDSQRQEIKNYALSNPIDYFVVERAEYSKSYQVISYEDQKINYKFLKIVNFFFDKEKKDKYLRLVQEREAYESVDNLIKQHKYKDIAYLVNQNGYKLTKNQQYLLKDSINVIISSAYDKKKLKEFACIEKIPLLIKQSIVLNEIYQESKFFDDNFKKLEELLEGYGDSTESKHELLQELVKAMNNINPSQLKRINTDFIKPLKRLFLNHISFFDDKNYVEFVKYLIKFKNYISNNVRFQGKLEDSGIDKLNELIKMAIDERNVSIDLYNEELLKIANQVKVLKDKNDEVIISNITHKNFQDNQEFNDILAKIKTGYQEIEANKEFLNVERHLRIKRMVEEHLSSMIEMYGTFKKGTESNIRDFKGNNIEETMRETLKDMLLSINSTIEIINTEKADELLLKSNKAKYLSSKL